MATQYINKNKEIVFLNNKNIAHERGNLDDGTIAYNAIPSLSLFNDTYNEVTGYTNRVELSAYGISCTVSSLSDAISNEVSSAEQRAFEYTEQLSGEFKDISAILYGAVTILDQDNHEIGHDLSVRKISNADYDQLVRTGGVSDNEIYIIHDDHYSARGQKIRNLADPIELSDATNKYYVDSTLSDLSTLTYNEASSYSNATSAYALETAKDYADNNFISYVDDRTQFTYDQNTHILTLTYYNNNGESKAITFDATQIVKNRIISGMSIQTKDGEKYLRISWQSAPGTEDYIDILLSGLFQLYKADVHNGIHVYTTSEGYGLSCSDVIARTTYVDAVSSKVDTLSGKVDTLAVKTDKIALYVHDLSSTNGIIDDLSTDIQTYQATTEKCTATLQHLTGPSGDITKLSGDVDDIKEKYISKAQLKACIDFFNTTNPSFNEVVQVLGNIKSLVSS